MKKLDPPEFEPKPSHEINWPLAIGAIVVIAGLVLWFVVWLVTNRAGS